MMMNIQRQPNASISAVSTGAASPVPSVDDPLKMPVASPRSRTANQSRTTRAPAGELRRLAQAQQQARDEELRHAGDETT